MFATEWTLGAAAAHEALDIRRQVFTGELGRPAGDVFDAYDIYAAHLLIRQDGAPIASARLYAIEGGLCASHICVLEGYRRQRYGDLAFRAIMNRAARMRAPLLEIAADQAYISYFLKFGFCPAGEVTRGAALMRVDPAAIVWARPCKGG
ncbi:MAG: GNAT family N-acetyltransferase [Clostridiales bacterium]|jgi:ElaA protein|nr:GNAT family N-acetyltransferase [Clostridiales bacterium]